MNISKVFSTPPNSLAELNDALQRVDHKTAFFDTDLRVVSKDVRSILKNIETPSGNTEIVSCEKQERARIVLAEITNVFMRTNFQAIEFEINRFHDLFSGYCIRLLTNQWDETFVAFVGCVQHSVKKIIKVMQSPGYKQEIQPLLLITDTDGKEHGAMGIRAARYLVQGIPVVMPEQLLFKLINYSFKPPWLSPFQADIRENCKLMSVKKACSEIANPEKWTIYTNGNLVTCLPIGSSHVLNLTNYKEVSYREIKRNAILKQIGQAYSQKKIEKEEIVEILSTDVNKHVVFAGHGALKGTDDEGKAMGMTLEKVAYVFNHSKNVLFWDLHSCFLLGNIRTIMDEVGPIDSTLKISNGLIASSYPPKESDDMVRAYFFLASKALNQDKPEKIAKIFPLMDSFYPENHPHLIHKQSKKIAPLTLTGIAEKGSTEGKVFTAPRLYLDALSITHPIQLSGKVALLPGLAEQNSQHFLKEVSTDQKFNDFIASAFGHACEGTQAFLIGKLQCQNGIYEKVIYFSKSQKARVFFFKENAWHTFSVTWENTEHSLNAKHNPFEVLAYTDDMEKVLQKIIDQTRPGNNIPTEDLKHLYALASETFALPLEWKESVKDTESTPKTKEGKGGLILAQKFDMRNEVTFFRALVLQDETKIEEFYHKASFSTVKKALEFCIERDLVEQFSILINIIRKLHPSTLNETVSQFSFKDFKNHDISLHHFIEIYAIKMRSVEILKLLNAECTEDALESAASYGLPAIFEIIHKDHIPIDLKSLRSLAEYEQNWDMVEFLSEKESLEKI